MQIIRWILLLCVFAFTFSEALAASDAPVKMPQGSGKSAKQALRPNDVKVQNTKPAAGRPTSRRRSTAKLKQPPSNFSVLDSLVTKKHSVTVPTATVKAVKPKPVEKTVHSKTSVKPLVEKVEPNTLNNDLNTDMTNTLDGDVKKQQAVVEMAEERLKAGVSEDAVTVKAETADTAAHDQIKEVKFANGFGSVIPTYPSQQAFNVDRVDANANADTKPSLLFDSKVEKVGNMDADGHDIANQKLNQDQFDANANADTKASLQLDNKVDKFNNKDGDDRGFADQKLNQDTGVADDLSVAAAANQDTDGKNLGSRVRRPEPPARRKVDPSKRRIAESRKQEEERRRADAKRAEEVRRLETFARLEKNLSMPWRYAVVPNGENFMIETGVNYEFPIWHAPYPLPGSNWPQPLRSRRSSNLIRINPEKFRFVLKMKTNAILRENIDRYQRIICEQKQVSVVSDFRTAAAYELLAASGNVAPLTSLEVRVRRHGEPYPHLFMDESYTLKISAQEAYIEANETWGAVRALETFSQIVMRTPDDVLYVNSSIISDEPRFRYRGILLDTARHFMAKETLLRNLDAMAMNKLNVFHWHIVDDSSFPYQSRVWPLLSARGAYDPLTMIYTHEDVKEIVEYARFRGIRVIPEFDTPGHTHSWGRGYPELLTPCYSTHYGGDVGGVNTLTLDQDVPEKPGIYRSDYGTLVFDGHFGPLNPAKNFTYEFIEKLFEEVLSLFPDEYLHLGADETGYNCWLSNPFVKAKISAAVRNSKAIYSYYLIRVHQLLKSIAERRGKPVKSQVWEEVYTEQIKARELSWDPIAQYQPQDNANSNSTSKSKTAASGSASNSVIPDDTTVHVWRSEPYVARQIAANGYDVVYSSCWYMDHLKGGPEWLAFYQCDPGYSDSETPPEIRRHFLGGEACMWAEHQDNTAVLSRIWPLAAATAERLWSSADLSDTFAAAPRMEEQRCRMITRGIPAGVASGSGTCIRLTPLHREEYMRQRVSLLKQLRKSAEFSSALRNVNIEELTLEAEKHSRRDMHQAVEVVKRRSSSSNTADEEFYSVVMRSVLIGVLLGTIIAVVIAVGYLIVVTYCLKRSQTEQIGKSRTRQSSRSNGSESLLLRCGVAPICRHIVVRRRACLILFGAALIVYAFCAVHVSGSGMLQPAKVTESTAAMRHRSSASVGKNSFSKDEDGGDIGQNELNGHGSENDQVVPSHYQAESYRFNDMQDKRAEEANDVDAQAPADSVRRLNVM